MRKRRKHSKIDKLPLDLKTTVETMLETGSTYGEIVHFLSLEGEKISLSSVCRYAKQYQVTVERLKMAQENFRALADEMAKYPELDYTEPLLRLGGQSLMTRLTEATEESWEEVDVKTLLKEIGNLTRAVAYKRSVDVKNREQSEAGLEEVKAIVFSAMAKERPELYKQVASYLNQKKGEFNA